MIEQGLNVLPIMIIVRWEIHIFIFYILCISLFTLKCTGNTNIAIKEYEHTIRSIYVLRSAFSAIR